MHLKNKEYAETILHVQQGLLKDSISKKSIGWQ